MNIRAPHFSACKKCETVFRPVWLEGLEKWSSVCSGCALLNLASLLEEPCEGDTIKDISDAEQTGAAIRAIVKNPYKHAH